MGVEATEVKILKKSWQILIVLAAIPMLVNDVATLPASIASVLAAIRDLSLELTVVILIALGIRHVRRSGRSRRALAYPVAGIVLAAVLLIVMAVAYNVLVSSLAAIGEDPHIDRRVDEVLSDPSSSASQRALASEYRAREAYFHHGEIRKYLTESGEAKEFEPSRDDKESRALLLDTQAIVPVSLQRLRASAGLLALLAIASFLVGCFSPIRSTSAT